MLSGQDLKTLQKTMGAGAGRQQERAALVDSGLGHYGSCSKILLHSSLDISS